MYIYVFLQQSEKAAGANFDNKQAKRRGDIRRSTWS